MIAAAQPPSTTLPERSTSSTTEGKMTAKADYTQIFELKNKIENVKQFKKWLLSTKLKCNQTFDEVVKDEDLCIIMKHLNEAFFNYSLTERHPLYNELCLCPLNFKVFCDIKKWLKFLNYPIPLIDMIARYIAEKFEPSCYSYSHKYRPFLPE